MLFFEAIILAIVEGLTEFLPVSSTGHMIIVSSLFGIASEPFTKTFIVAIQLGAILSVIVLYWKRFFQSINFYLKLIVAVLPAALLGFLLNDFIDQLLERIEIVAIMLILGGVVFLYIDKFFKETEEHGETNVDFSTAFNIGLFQCIAMLPGVSRSAATIIGGLTQKLTKKTAAEFSFFLAVPTMFLATAYKLFNFYHSGGSFGENEIQMLVVGNLAAFVVATLAIKSFISYLTKYGFKVFGYYRITLGIIILTLYLLGVELNVV
jgi:undecaprenyl-diphosphatase